MVAFVETGSPDKQRKLQADRVRVEHLRSIANGVHFFYISPTAARQLPESLDEIEKRPGRPLLEFRDPESGQVYEYLKGEGSRYQLCAKFNFESPKERNRSTPRFWVHPAGRHCFALDAAISPSWQ